jgi:hypothetical protein
MQADTRMTLYDFICGKPDSILGCVTDYSKILIYCPYSLQIKAGVAI